MESSAEPAVRDAADDVAAICRFGEAHIRSHYASLIGAEAADAQVGNWWNERAATVPTTWSTSSMWIPSIAAVGRARSYLRPQQAVAR
jgi:hypothetical protein